MAFLQLSGNFVLSATPSLVSSASLQDFGKMLLDTLDQ